jgi:damage-control phosphatase, subfamily I
MKASEYCYGCLQKLAYQAAELGAPGEKTRARAVQEGLRILRDNFSIDCVSIVVATRIHNVIKEITGNRDPYRLMKDKEIEIGRELSQQVKVKESSFMSCLKFAALGNTIDFFRSLDVIIKDMKQPVNFVINDARQFETRLEITSRILYLADNAGEVFFDLPLVRYLRRRASVAYVVKSAPVQNDVTLDDIKRAGLEDELGEILTTGTATPGIDFSLASTGFKREFKSADLIFAKGMGYYESLSELPSASKVLFCLRAKCQPVADSLKVPLNSYVVMLW